MWDQIVCLILFTKCVVENENCEINIGVCLPEHCIGWWVVSCCSCTTGIGAMGLEVTEGDCTLY